MLNFDLQNKLAYVFLIRRNKYTMDLLHKPVLLQETLDSIPKSAKYILDGTLGHGGHSLAILEHFKNIKLIWLDIDEKMLIKAKKRLKNYPNSKIIHDSYANIDKIGETEHITWFDYILLDLWVNMEHFKDTERGFSVKNDAKLDMRFDRTQTESAYEFIKYWSAERLGQAFIKYADFTEKKAKEISQKILLERRRKPITTTYELKDIIKSCWVWEKACTVLFQAIRIEINQEMNKLKTFLEKMPDALSVWWRCAIMSYHSIEDRITKLAFKELKTNGFNGHIFKLINKKAIQAHYTEVQKNKAARSAKFRIIEKL